MKETELKPCPFCGGKAKLNNRAECCGHGCFVELHYVACTNCKASGAVADSFLDNGDDETLKTLAIKRWNRRADDERKAD